MKVMRFRVPPPKDVAAEISGFDKKDLAALMRRAALRMAEGDADEHIRRAVAWEGHSEAFSGWLVQEVRASFRAFGWQGKNASLLELWARAASRLAVFLVLLLFAAWLSAQTDSPVAAVAAIPVVFLAFVYLLAFILACVRLARRLSGHDRPPSDER